MSLCCAGTDPRSGYQLAPAVFPAPTVFDCPSKVVLPTGPGQKWQSRTAIVCVNLESPDIAEWLYFCEEGATTVAAGPKIWQMRT